MPFSNLPKSKWKKMDRCVKDVMKGDPKKTKQSAIAICYTSLTGNQIDATQLELLGTEFDKNTSKVDFEAGLSWVEPTEADIRMVHSLVGAQDTPAAELVKFEGAILARAERNGNGDGLDEDGLNELAATLPLMALDDEHIQSKVVGFFINGEVQDSALLTSGIMFACLIP